MKTKLALTCGFALSLSAFAETNKTFEVLLRQQGSNRSYYEHVELKDLMSENSFDGKYFKIVKGKGKEAILFDEKDSETLLKAANVYHHLSEARKFWVDHIESDVAKNLPKMVIRLDIKNQFDELGHYAHDNKTPQFNNALTVPEGETPEWVPADRQDKWGKEIWFRPMKSILTKDLGQMGPNPLTVGLRGLEQPLLDYTQNQFSQRLMEQLFYPAYASRTFQQDLVRYAGTLALMKVIIWGSRYTDKLFVDKYYYLETAMIPEIAYHEYAHVVLSDHIKMSHSTPVNEGLADYFAAVQSQTRNVYGKVPGYSNAAPKDTQQKRPYSHWDESNRNATADFTLSILWDVRETLGSEIGDKVVYQARTFLKTKTSTISDGLLRAILRACEIKCKEPRSDKYKLYQTFLKKGF